MGSETISDGERRALFDRVSNWGRWGAEDERGALNLITPAKRAEAARLVADGVAVSCALPLPTAEMAPLNPTPVQHFVARGGDAGTWPGRGFTGTSDYFAIAPHGYFTTHLDALCHIGVDGKMYNGFPMTEVKTTGAWKGSIMAGSDGIVSRGVVLDIPAVRGVPHLEPGEAIRPGDLEAAEQRQGVTVAPGDILLVAVGRDARREAKGDWNAALGGTAGLHPDCAQWLRERDVAVLGSDGISDVLPDLYAGWTLPIHQLTLVAMGVHLIDNAQLGRLLAACRERNRYAFQLTLAPLRLERGTASPINPVALF